MSGPSEKIMSCPSEIVQFYDDVIIIIPTYIKEYRDQDCINHTYVNDVIIHTYNIGYTDDDVIILTYNIGSADVGMLIRHKDVQVPPDAKTAPLGQKRKQGRPSKATKTLLVQ
ncbi:hypothetical protein V9T40_008026 [Parthenolecanium corni]|uniref:Uncharacterized protein n=1 Tax=Parthenolecanium corni TaxID=536013 RepID=A0AAN9TPD1_9HEMI